MGGRRTAVPPRRGRLRRGARSRRAPPGSERLELGGIRGHRAEPHRIEPGAVAIRRAGGRDAEPAGHGSVARFGAGRMVRVRALDPVEPDRGQFLDHVVGDAEALPVEAGVGDHGQPAGALDQPDGVHRIEGMLLYVRPPAVLDQLGGEGVLDRVDHAGLDQRLGDVGAHDVLPLGDLPDPLERDRVAERLELPHHGLAPGEAIVTEPAELRLKHLVVEVDPVRQQVDPVAVLDRGKLDAGDDLGRVVGGRERAREALGRIVVGHCQDRQPAFASQRHQLLWRERAIRVRGVGVEVDHGGNCTRWARAVVHNTGMPSRLDELVAATPATRDRYVDFLRALSILVVVVGHWLIGVIFWEDGVIGSTIPFGPLWFLAVYAGVLGLSPVMIRLHERFGLGVIAVMLVGAVAADAIGFITAFEEARWANVAFVWLLPHQLGFFYADGRITRLSRGALWSVALGGLGAMLLLSNPVFGDAGREWFPGIGHYPKSLLGTDVERITNTYPPTIMLVAMSFWSIGLALLVREPLSRWLRRPRPWKATIFVNSVIMTLFLWHMTAFLLAILVLWPPGFGQQSDTTAGRWLERPLWVAVPGVFLAALVAVFGRFERPPLRRRTEDDRERNDVRS